MKKGAIFIAPFCVYVCGKQVSALVLPQIRHARNMNLPALDDDQPQFRKFVQDAREVFLGQVEAGGDNALVGGQGDGDIDALLVLFGQFAQQVTDDALLAGMQRVGFDVVHQLVQAHGHSRQHLAA